MCHDTGTPSPTPHTWPAPFGGVEWMEFRQTFLPTRMGTYFPAGQKAGFFILGAEQGSDMGFTQASATHEEEKRKACFGTGSPVRPCEGSKRGPAGWVGVVDFSAARVHTTRPQVLSCPFPLWPSLDAIKSFCQGKKTTRTISWHVLLVSEEGREKEERSKSVHHTTHGPREWHFTLAVVLYKVPGAFLWVRHPMKPGGGSLIGQ